MLKLVSKFDCLLTFMVFAMSKKTRMKPFLYLEGALKLILQEQFKNTATKIFKIQRKFHHSMTCPNDMIRTLVLTEFL